MNLRLNNRPSARRVGGALQLAGRFLLRNLPLHRTSAHARGLQRRADAARDARQYQLAAALYGEAAALTPGRPRLHMQCGHMLKEAGDLDGAEYHYGIADRLLPDDPDTALQLGHFYKVASRPDQAEAAYTRALRLRPGWDQASEELNRLRGTISADIMERVDRAKLDWIVPELLPQTTGSPVSAGLRERMQISHLAPRRARGPDGMMKMLSGVEAVRGFFISARPITNLQLLLDEQEVAELPLEGISLADGSDRRKFVFNLWHNFADVPAARYRLELRLRAGKSVVRTHRDNVLVVPPSGHQEELSQSDGFVPSGDLRSGPDLPSSVNSLPSVIRPARRSNLPASVSTILVQRADQLGDLAVSVPAIKRIRELFPAARLIGLLTPANSGLAETLGLFDEIVETRFEEDPADGRRTLGIEAQETLRTQLLRLSIDIAIDLAEVSETRPLLLLSNAKFLFGFKARDWPWLSAGFELSGRDPINRHENLSTARKLMAMVEALGMMRPTAVQLTVPERSRSESILDGSSLQAGNYIVLHAGARLAFSRWQGFSTLARMLLERTHFDLVILGDNLQLGEQTARLHHINTILPFQDFDRLIASAALFIGNDSGPKHLAALRGTPTISLHMARLNWSEWGQEGSGLIISRRVPCAGCGVHNHPEECGAKFACITNIRPEEVMDAAMRLLADQASTQH